MDDHKIAKSFLTEQKLQLFPIELFIKHIHCQQSGVTNIEN